MSEDDPPLEPSDNRASRLPRGQLFSDDQSGLPEGDAIGPIGTGCMALGFAKLGCLLIWALLMGVAVLCYLLS